MPTNSAIGWTGVTCNPWRGCSKVGPECKYCYMFRDYKRYGRGDPTVVTRCGPGAFRKPYKIQREFDQGKRQRPIDRVIFVCSWSDFWHEEADEWRPEFWQIMRECPNLHFQLLTKRPERVVDHLPSYFAELAPRISFGVTIGVQASTDRLYYLALMKQRYPAVTTFVSFEPLVGPIDLLAPMMCEPLWDLISPQHGFIHAPIASDLAHFLDWGIIGGESGKDARIMWPRWADAVFVVLRAAGIPIYFKQWGEWSPYEPVKYARYPSVTEQNVEMWRVGRRGAGDLWNGQKVQEFPLSYGIEKR